MIVVFDMDNTLTDDFGGEMRPGIPDLLGRLTDDGLTLKLWTHSTRDRANDILALHGLDGFFAERLYREDYDPQGLGGQPKDIRRMGGEFLVDDDPMQIDYVTSIGLRGFLVTAYRGGADPDPKELGRAYAAITEAPNSRWFSWLRRS